jgi:hypothetical protein
MKALFLHKQNTKKVLKRQKKQSSMVLDAFQDDICFSFVQKQTNAMKKE